MRMQVQSDPLGLSCPAMAALCPMGRSAAHCGGKERGNRASIATSCIKANTCFFVCQEKSGKADTCWGAGRPSRGQGRAGVSGVCSGTLSARPLPMGRIQAGKSAGAGCHTAPALFCLFVSSKPYGRQRHILMTGFSLALSRTGQPPAMQRHSPLFEHGAPVPILLSEISPARRKKSLHRHCSGDRHHRGAGWE